MVNKFNKLFNKPLSSRDINIDKDVLFNFKNLNLKYFILDRKNKQTALN